MVEPLERPLSSYIHAQFVTVNENTSVAETVKILQPKHVEIILVTSSNGGKYVGIVTDSDILEKVVMKGEDSDLVSIKSIMSSPIISLPSSATVKQAIELMRARKIKHLPVTDITNKEQIIGTVTQEYLAEAIRIAVVEKTFRSYRKIIREHYKPIFANVAIILQFSGLLMVIPALLGTFLGEWESSIGIYIAFVGMFLTGYIMNILGEKSPLNLKQSSIVVVLSFFLLSLFGSLPYMYLNPFYDGIDLFSLFSTSFMESTSGFTTTGISTILNPENLPESFSFYRSYTELVGGLSFIYLIMALYYLETKLAGMKQFLGSGVLRFKQLLSTICIIFTIYTIVVALLIFIFGNVNLLDSISLAITTFTNGGFVPASTALNTEDEFTLFIIIGGMIIAALPFAFHFGIFSKYVHATQELKEILIFLILLTFFIFLFLFIESSFLEKEWISSIFHIISASTTAGFQFIDLSQISLYGKLLLIVVMLIGGTAFSTTGGIKIARLLLIFNKLINKEKKTSINHFNNKNKSTLPPLISATAIQFRKRIQQPFKISEQEKKETAKNNKQIICDVPLDRYKYNILSDKAFREAIFVIILYISFTITTALGIYFLEHKNNNNFIDVVFEAATTISNNGLSVGLISMDMDSISKMILSFNMIMGRFEIIAILYIFISKLRRY
ncbi:MAG TPA: potassium transporter TrkG [Nitrososphaeraceae archaeon]|nr:potassium transporter TrkG [Nitrososphaeraceae archaeon]